MVAHSDVNGRRRDLTPAASNPVAAHVHLYDISPYSWGRPRLLSDYRAGRRQLFEGTYRRGDGFEKPVMLEYLETDKSAELHQALRENLQIIHGRWVQLFDMRWVGSNMCVLVRERTSGLTLRDLLDRMHEIELDQRYSLTAYVAHELVAAWMYLEMLGPSRHGALSSDLVEFSSTGHIKFTGFGYGRIGLALSQSRAETVDDDVEDRKRMANLITEMLTLARADEPNDPIAACVRELIQGRSKSFQTLYRQTARRLDQGLLHRGQRTLQTWVERALSHASLDDIGDEATHALVGQWMDAVHARAYTLPDGFAQDADAHLRTTLIHGLGSAASTRFDDARVCAAKLAQIDDSRARQTLRLLNVMCAWLRGDLSVWADESVPEPARDVLALWTQSFAGRLRVMRQDYTGGFETLSAVYRRMAEFVHDSAVHPVWGSLLTPATLRDQCLAWMAMIDVLVFESDEGIGHLNAIVDKHARASQIWWLLETQTLLGWGLHRRGETQRALDMFLQCADTATQHGQRAFQWYARHAREAVLKRQHLPFFGDHAALTV